MSDEWTWQFRAPAKRTYDRLDAHARDRITDKLDQIMNDRWRDPDGVFSSPAVPDSSGRTSFITSSRSTRRTK